MSYNQKQEFDKSVILPLKNSKNKIKNQKNTYLGLNG